MIIQSRGQERETTERQMQESRCSANAGPSHLRATGPWCQQISAEPGSVHIRTAAWKAEMNIYLPTGSALPGVHFISRLLTPRGIIGLGEALGRRKEVQTKPVGSGLLQYWKEKEMMWKTKAGRKLPAWDNQDPGILRAKGREKRCLKWRSLRSSSQTSEVCFFSLLNQQVSDHSDWKPSFQNAVTEDLTSFYWCSKPLVEVWMVCVLKIKSCARGRVG